MFPFCYLLFANKRFIVCKDSVHVEKCVSPENSLATSFYSLFQALSHQLPHFLWSLLAAAQSLTRDIPSMNKTILKNGSPFLSITETFTIHSVHVKSVTCGLVFQSVLPSLSGTFHTSRLTAEPKALMLAFRKGYRSQKSSDILYPLPFS